MTSATTAGATARPRPDEYAPYYEKYVSRVPDGEIVEVLRTQIGETLALLGGLPEERALHRYGPGKWSVKEVVGHMIDLERIMSYRMLRIARGDTTPLPGFDENAYVPAGSFDARPLSSLRHDFEVVRAATLALLESLDANAAARRGTASNFEVTARAVAYIIAGHERHHVAILRERYLT